MARKMPAIPQDAAAGFQAMKEIIERREGVRGDKSDAFVTLVDLQPPKWESVTYLNGWTTYDASFAPAGFYKDAFGIVRLRGLIKSGTVPATAFVLPLGYRPQYRVLFSTISSGAVGRVDVSPAGEVYIEAPSTNTWVALDGLAFRVA